MSSQSEKENTPPKFIDVERVIGNRNPRLLKLLPKFLLRYISRKLHEDEMNDAVSRNKNAFGHDFVDTTMEEFELKTKAVGTENIPREGGVIIAANHPLGGLDGIALMDVVGEYRKDIKFFVNDILMTIKNFAPIFVPVNKLGRNSSAYAQKFEEVYASDNCLLIFPAGLVSRRQKRNVIEDLPWKKSVITKAVKYKKNIVPTFISGHNSDFFYNLAYWRKKIGIKANIEMFYLPDEMYKQRGKTIIFTFGEPIAWQTFTKEYSAEHWAEKLKQHTYALQSGDKSKMLPTINNQTVSN